MSDLRHCEVGVESIGGGALIERANLALEQVIENLLDPNTASNDKREVVIKLGVKTDHNREQMNYTISVVAKLAPPVGVGGTGYIGLDNGAPKMYEANRKQTNIFDEFNRKDGEK